MDALALHTANVLSDELWKKARKNAGTRMRFFEILRTRVIYQIVPLWRVFIDLFANGREPP